MQIDIRKNLFGALAAIVLMLVVVAALSFNSIRKLASGFDLMFKNNMQAAVQLSKVEGALWELRFGLPQYMLQDDAGRAKVRQDTPKWTSIIDENIRLYSTGIRSAEESSLRRAFDDAFARYMAARPGFFDLWDAGKKDEALAYRASNTNPAAAEAVKTLKSLVQLQQRLAESRRDEQDAEVSFIRNALIIAVALSFFVSAAVFGLVAWVQRQLTRRLRALRSGVAAVSKLASQVAEASSSMSSGALNQAAAIEQTGAAIEQINCMAKSNVQFALGIGKVIGEAGGCASQADNLLGEMAVFMSEIRQSSQKVSGIMRVINEIAFQTNLLALNAAVEAARAGEAGAGFAVVAEEVRSLAHRCGQASKEIAPLIEESLVKISMGGEHLEKATAQMSTMRGAVVAIGPRIEEVSRSSQEQSSGVQNVSTAMSSLERVAGETSARASSCGSASDQLQTEANQMMDLLQQLVV